MIFRQIIPVAVLASIVPLFTFAAEDSEAVARIDGAPVAIRLTGLVTTESPYGPALRSASGNKDALGELPTPALGRDGASFAVEAWFYVTEHKNPNVLLANRGRQNCWQLAVIDDGRPWLTFWTSPTATFMLPAKNAVSKNAWHHIAVNKHDDGLVELYVDGKFSDAKTMDAQIQSIAQATRVIPQGFSGQIAGIRIHNGKTIVEERLAEIRALVASAARK